MRQFIYTSKYLTNKKEEEGRYIDEPVARRVNGVVAEHLG